MTEKAGRYKQPALCLQGGWRGASPRPLPDTALLDLTSHNSGSSDSLYFWTHAVNTARANYERAIKFGISF